MSSNLVAVFIMISFALNSLFCRLAVGSGSIDAMSYAMWRSVAAFLTLACYLLFKWWKTFDSVSNILSTFVLSGETNSTSYRSRLWRALAWLAYSLTFSWAYTRLDTGLGALVLFGATQFTMIVLGGRRGERVPPQAWGGVALATLGLGIVTLRFGIGGIAVGALGAMAVAGISWGGYSLLARRTTEPAAAICEAFFLSLPVLLLVCSALSFFGMTHQTVSGIAWASVSGVITTAGGYCAWYIVMAKWEESTSNAALKGGVWQLSVPVFAALLGILFLKETNSIQLWLGIAFVVAGIAAAITASKARIEDVSR